MSAMPCCGARSALSSRLSRADHVPHLPKGACRLRLDHPQHIDGRLGTSGCEGLACLGLDHDRRHMVRHRVVELACELFTLSVFHVVEFPGPRGAPVADHATDGCRQKEDRQPADRIADRAGIDGDADRPGDGHDHCADGDVAPRTPSHQGVGQHQDECHRVQPGRRLGAGDRPGDAEHRRRGERQRQHRERVRASPEHRCGDAETRQQCQTRPDEVVAKERLGNGRDHDHAEQHPVAPDACGRIGDRRLGEEGANCGIHDETSVEIPAGRRIGRKDDPPSAGRSVAKRPMARCPAGTSSRRWEPAPQSAVRRVAPPALG